MAESDSERRIEHPNRKKAASKLMRLLVILLLLVSAGLVLIVTLGGWAALEGAKPLAIVFVLVYLVLAYFVARWSRGVLPLIAALATLLLIFSAVSTPAWFNRAQNGFTDPALPSDLLGLITGLLVPVQVLLIAVAMSGFRQAWNVEVEVGSDEDDDGRDRGRGRQREREREEDEDRRMEPGGGPHRAREEEPADEAPTREEQSTRDEAEQPTREEQPARDEQPTREEQPARDEQPTREQRPRPETGSGGASPAPA